MSNILSVEERALNSLAWACRDFYGSVSRSLNSATPETIGKLREDDITILKNTAHFLPNIKQNEETDFCLAVHLAHMNTFEGMDACAAIIAQYFSPLPNDITRHRNAMESRRQEWLSCFGEKPIRPDEYVTPINVKSTAVPSP